MRFGRFLADVGHRCAIASLATLSLSACLATGAIAREVDDFPVLPQGVRFGEIPYEFENQFFSHDRDYVRNRSFTGQLKRIFGPFPENSMNRDSKATYQLYRETFYKQMNSGPVLRTVDLPSPFQYSLRTLPPPPVVAPIEVVPPPAAIEVPTPIAPSKPVAPKPVPALW